MSLLKKIRKQPILIWESLSKDKFGKTQFALPIEFLSRVESQIEETIDNDGKKAITKKVLYLERDFKPGSYISEDITLINVKHPDTNPTCNKIIKSTILPKIRYNETLFQSFI